MNTINVIYFSNMCEGSKTLIAMLQMENLARFFHMVCIDGNPRIPAQITVTPTLIIRGCDSPYIAGNAFAWLARVKEWKNKVELQKMNLAQQQHLRSINGNLLADNLDVRGFSSAEMGGMSDIFSFFSKNMAQECNEAFPQSFYVCDNLGKDQIFTPPLEGGSHSVKKDTKSKLTAEQQKLLVKERETSRKQYDSQLKEGLWGAS